MSDTKHTPGPWAWSDAGTRLVATGHLSGAYIFWPRNIGGESDARQDGWASALGSPDTTDEESEANARLISAAPELLAALESVVKSSQFDIRDDDLAAARAAIAKATGAA